MRMPHDEDLIGIATEQPRHLICAGDQDHTPPQWNDRRLPSGESTDELPLISKLVAEGKVCVVGGFQPFGTGQVEIIA